MITSDNSGEEEEKGGDEIQCNKFIYLGQFEFFE